MVRTAKKTTTDKKTVKKTTKKKIAPVAKVLAKKKATSVKKTTAKKTASSAKVVAKTKAAPVKKKNAAKKTQVVVRFDVGFNNAVYLRGNGPSLSWDKGTLLKNVGNDTWVWETTKSFNSGEFKVLINDLFFEAGENRQVQAGETVEYTPQFPPSW